jgi:hypothetical protein
MIGLSAEMEVRQAGVTRSFRNQSSRTARRKPKREKHMRLRHSPALEDLFLTVKFISATGESQALPKVYQEKRAKHPVCGYACAMIVEPPLDRAGYPTVFYGSA